MTRLFYVPFVAVCLVLVTLPVGAQKLADAAAAAAKTKRTWTTTTPAPTVLTNKDLPATIPSPVPVTSDGPPATVVKDAAYWKDRVRPSRTALEESNIAVESQQRLVNDFRVGGLEWTKATNELIRLMDVNLNNMHHFTEAFDEAKGAGFTPEKYDGPSHKYKDK